MAELVASQSMSDDGGYPQAHRLPSCANEEVIVAMRRLGCLH